MNNLRFFFALLLFPLLFSACKKSDDAQPQTIANVLTNGDMEATSNNDWGSYLGKVSATSPNTYTVGYSTEAASSPAHSIKVSCNVVKNDSTYQDIQQVLYTANTPIPAGAKLTLKAKIKTANVQGPGIVLAIGGNQGASASYASAFYTSTEGKLSITGTNDFKEYSLTFDSFPVNATSLYVLLFFSPKTTGTAYYDDVSLSVN